MNNHLQAQVFAGTMTEKLYPSSVRKDLKLSAEFYVPAVPKPLCLFFHGWHMTAAQSAKCGYIAELTPYFFVVNVDMRGRGGKPGQPDANGFELIDALDALSFARQTWPQAISHNEAPKMIGGSGGGGNVLALAGKAPDIFSAGASWAGITDFAALYEGDERGRIRDEMETKGWIGGTPSNNAAGYRARGGLYLIENVRSALLVVHGRKDTSVPFYQVERYKDRAEQLGKTNIQFLFNDLGHASEQWPEMIAHLTASSQAPTLSQTGMMRVHSFLACKAFWLILDDPGKMGTANYRLDEKGRLAELKFVPDAEAAPQKLTLRLFAGLPSVKVSFPNNSEILPGSAAENYTDFCLAVDKVCAVTIIYPNPA